jgi:hypothetical protein
MDQDERANMAMESLGPLFLRRGRGSPLKTGAGRLGVLAQRDASRAQSHAAEVGKQ